MTNNQQRYLEYLITGFAIFSMFFGAGNLIYPLYIGSISLSTYPWSILGITVTGIILPLLGIISIIIYEGNVMKFFGRLGKYVSLPLIILILALIGPMIAVPRCIIISFAGFKALFNSIELPWFNAVFCFLLSISVWHKTKVVEILGKWLTPILIIGVTTIIICAFFGNNMNSFPTTTLSNVDSFCMSALQGYQTMDLCAAIFFGIIIFEYIHNTHSSKSTIKNSIIASVIGVFLLFIVYATFIYIGAKYSILLNDVPKEQMLMVITQKAVGRLAIPIASVTILTACLTTAIALIDLVVNWVADMLKIKPEKRGIVIIAVVATSFAFTLFGFNTLTTFLSIILFVLYPGLIAITIANIIDYALSTNTVRPAFWLACISSFIYNIMF